MTTRPMPNGRLPDDWYLGEIHADWDLYGWVQLTETTFCLYRDTEKEWEWLQQQGLPGDLVETEIKGNDGHGFMRTSIGPGGTFRPFYIRREFTFHNKGDAVLFKLTFF